jgi:hypothetical protein
LAIVVKFLLKVVTDTVPETDELADVVVVDDELLELQAATNSPLATIIVATTRLRVSLTVLPPSIRSAQGAVGRVRPVHDGRYSTMNIW